MKPPLKLIPILLAAGWLSTGIASAGTFQTDFSTYPAITLVGSAPATWTGTNVILTPAANNLTGGATIWDTAGGGFNDGKPIESFVARFKLQLGPGTANAADGTSFNFGTTVNEQTPSGEEGPGGNCITIAFDIYDNGLAAEGHPTPSLDIRYQGQTVATHAFSKADMVTSQMEDVFVELKRSGYMSVSYKGQQLFTNVLVPHWAPCDPSQLALFNWSARTGGENCYQAIGNVNITTVLVGTPVAVSITADPQNVNVDEHGTATFGVTLGVDGSAPFTFQWIKNNVDIPNETNATLTLTAVPFTDNNAKFKVRVSNAVNTVTSGEATLTVNRDTVAPTLVKAAADSTYTKVTVTFSEPVSDTALSASNYRIDQGINVLSVARLDASHVALTTSTMGQGLIYTLTVSGVQDLASSPPNTIAANSKVTFGTYVFQAATVLHKKYLNFNDGASYQTLFSDPRYNSNPDRQDLMPMWEYPANGAGRDYTKEPDGGQYRNYMDTLEGFFIPATSGDYVFYIAGADIVTLFLSTDSDPANKKLVANFGGWTNPREWLKPQSPNNDHSNDGQTNNLRTDYFTGTQWPAVGPNGGAQISLVAGQKYYMELIHADRSWSGGDDFAVTFGIAGQADPAVGSAPLLTGNVVGTYVDPSGASITFTTEPADVPILQGRTATFTAVVEATSAYTGGATYQWQTAPAGSTTFTDIPGATKASYTTGTLGLADSGRQYKLLATVPGLTKSSRVATVTVNADTIPPHLVAASALASQSGSTFDVGVTFDEPLDAASAGTLANYSISSGTISAVKFFPQSPGVVLTVSGLTVGNNYTVTVVNVADPYGNKMPSTPIALTVGPMKWGVIGSDELGLGSGVLAVASNAFDVYSDGLTEWGAYDEATLVFEQITGDFDKEVRVEFQDSSSEWARAGIVVRDVPNFGVNRATQQGSNSTPGPWDGTAGRYQKVHVNPVLTAMGTRGNNSWECNRRLDTGGQTTSAGGGGTPQYPNAWCRIQRRGQTFNVFSSNDGVTWASLGSTTWGVTDTNKITMPNTLYVGLDYSPENGNVTPATLQSVWVAKFRDYRTHSDVVPPPVMTWVKTPTGFTITYEGTLESNTNLSNASGWVSVPSATSPYPVAPVAGPPMFFRARK